MQKTTLTLWFLAALVAGGVPNHAQAFSVQMDLISPNTCNLSGDRLSRCVIAPRTFTGAVPEAAVPMRTKIEVRKTGSCATQYRMEVAVSLNGEPATNVRYLQHTSVIARRLDRQSVNQVSVVDASTWTRSASLPGSCRVSLVITANEVDVNSQAEAQAIITAIENELAAKRTQVEWYRQLVAYREAFLFLQSIANNFRVQLTQGVIQDLREEAVAASDSLALLVGTSCGDELSVEDSANIFFLLASLPGLGEPASWTHPDGTPMTLAEFMGPREREIYDTVDRLARAHGGENGSDYEQAYTQAVAEAIELEHKLNLARTQLAAWL
jgi:hypothetical protein